VSEREKDREKEKEMWKCGGLRDRTEIRAPTVWQPANNGAETTGTKARDSSRKRYGPQAFSRVENNEKDNENINNRGLAVFTFPKVKFSKR